MMLLSVRIFLPGGYYHTSRIFYTVLAQMADPKASPAFLLFFFYTAVTSLCDLFMEELPLMRANQPKTSKK